MSGAVDIIVVRQPDGSLRSTPFHVRYGKSKCLRPDGKVVLSFFDRGVGQDIRERKNDAAGDADLAKGSGQLFRYRY